MGVVTVNCTGKMGFRPNNLMTKAFIMKFVELFFVFIVFLLFRVGQGGDIFYWGTGPRYPTTTTNSAAPQTTITTTTAPSTTTTTSITTTTTATAKQNEFVVGDLGGVFAYHPQPR